MFSISPILHSFQHASPFHKLHLAICLLIFYWDTFESTYPNNLLLNIVLILIPAFYLVILLPMFFWYKTVKPFPHHEVCHHLSTTGTWKPFHFPSSSQRTITDERNRMLYYICNGVASVSKMLQGYQLWMRTIAPLWQGLETYTGYCGGWEDKGSLVYWVVVIVLTFNGVVLEIGWVFFTWAPYLVILLNQYFVLVELGESIKNAETGNLAEKGDVKVSLQRERSSRTCEEIECLNLEIEKRLWRMEQRAAHLDKALIELQQSLAV